MKRIIKILIAAAIVALILNDGGRWAQAVIDLRSSTGQVLDQAALTARRSSQPQLANQLAQAAAIQQIRVTQYALTPTGVRIWTSGKCGSRPDAQRQNDDCACARQQACSAHSTPAIPNELLDRG